MNLGNFTRDAGFNRRNNGRNSSIMGKKCFVMALALVELDLERLHARMPAQIWLSLTRLQITTTRHHHGRDLWSSFRQFASASSSARASAGTVHGMDSTAHIVSTVDPLTGAGTIATGGKL